MFRAVQRRFGSGKIIHFKLPMWDGGEGEIIGPLVDRNAALVLHQRGKGEVAWNENLLVFDAIGTVLFRAAADDKDFFEVDKAWRNTGQRGYVFAGKASDGKVDIARFQPS